MDPSERDAIVQTQRDVEAGLEPGTSLMSGGQLSSEYPAPGPGMEAIGSGLDALGNVVQGVSTLGRAGTAALKHLPRGGGQPTPQGVPQVPGMPPLEVPPVGTSVEFPAPQPRPAPTPGRGRQYSSEERAEMRSARRDPRVIAAAESAGVSPRSYARRMVRGMRNPEGRTAQRYRDPRAGDSWRHFPIDTVLAGQEPRPGSRAAQQLAIDRATTRMANRRTPPLDISLDDPTWRPGLLPIDEMINREIDRLLFGR